LTDGAAGIASSFPRRHDYKNEAIVKPGVLRLSTKNCDYDGHR